MGRAGVSGALSGLRVLELGAIGPVPFAATMLADHGATVLRITSGKPDLGVVEPGKATHLRGRPTVALNLRDEQNRATFLTLVESADVLLEGFRPGVLERLKVGPETLLERNPRLIIGRMTGWGQDGPMATQAGHDINYIAVAGALRNFARLGERPVPPVNLVGDYGGGAMYLLFGVLAALWQVDRGGCGQVVDAAMVDGAASLMGLVYSMAGQGLWPGPPGTNLLDTGAPFYDVYACADGEYVAVGCLEPAFYAEFLAGLAVDPQTLPAQYDPAGWPTLRATFAEALGAQPRSHWEQVFGGTDACVTPVLSMAEAPKHEHLVVRQSFDHSAGVVAPGVAPRLSATPGRAGDVAGAASPAELADWGLSPEVISRLRPA